MHAEISSKLVEAASYEEDRRFLRVFMTNGELREFVEVPRTVFEGLVHARSPGTFYMDEIRSKFSHPK